MGSVNRSVRSAAIFGLMAGLATVAVAEAVRPRGGTGLLLDWEDVRRRARSWLASSSAPAVDLGSAERQYRLMAAQLQGPLLKFVGALPKGASLPEFSALDRSGWLDLNLSILRRVVDPILEKGRLPNSLAVEAGRAGLNHYVAFLLAFLGTRATRQGVYLGIGASLLFTAWATLTQGATPILHLGRFNYPWLDLLIGALANVVLFIVGYGASLFFPREQTALSQITIWKWFEVRRSVPQETVAVPQERSA